MGKKGDTYNNFLKELKEEKNKKRYEEIAMALRYQLRGIIFGNMGTIWGRYWLIVVLVISICFLLVVPLLDKVVINEEHIQNAAGTIFTAFIALLGLLAVFFVFKVNMQKERTGSGINSMYKLIEEHLKCPSKFPGIESKKYREYMAFKNKKAELSTKELLCCIEEKYMIPLNLKSAWIYTVNQLYIGHVIRDYFIRNITFITLTILVSFSLMSGISFKSDIPVVTKGLVYSIDIFLAVISILYIFWTLDVMTAHVYNKGNIKSIHNSHRGLASFCEETSKSFKEEAESILSMDKEQKEFEVIKGRLELIRLTISAFIIGGIATFVGYYQSREFLLEIFGVVLIFGAIIHIRKYEKYLDSVEEHYNIEPPKPKK